MKHKELLAELLNTFLPKNFIGVEIGVDHADTTVCLLECCPNLSKLYAVDPYQRRSDRYNTVREQLVEYAKCELLRMTSNDAVDIVPDDLDFIFIDGDHSYQGVRSDLENYVPKLKSGALLTGHDWTCVRKEFGVVQACCEYLIENQDMFHPLYTNKELLEKNLGDFKRGGWDKNEKRHLIHKKRPSAFPLWWLIKR